MRYECTAITSDLMQLYRATDAHGAVFYCNRYLATVDASNLRNLPRLSIDSEKTSRLSDYLIT
jgi:hypothetical protein